MPIYKVDGVKKDGLQKYNVRINYISDGGVPKQLTRTAYGHEAAKDLERQLTEEQKQTGGVTAKKMTVQQLFDEHMETKNKGIRDSSMDRYKWDFKIYIAPMFKDVRIDRLTAPMLQKWKNDMEQQDLSLNTKKHAFSVVRAMLNYAVKMEYLPKNPLLRLDNFKDNMSVTEEMEFYTAQEFKKFIGAAENVARGKKDKNRDLSEWDFFVFFNIAFYTGLRKGEINALKWSDIDGSYLSVKRSISQKGGCGDRETLPKNKSSIRTLQMPKPLIAVLDEHKKRQMKLKGFSEEYRICGGEICLRDATIQRRNELYAELAGVKTIRIHDYRHSHASLLANEGINIQEIARRLGHARVEMTWSTYSHLYPREEERAVEILNNIA
jgi:integrase